MKIVMALFLSVIAAGKIPAQMLDLSSPSATIRSCIAALNRYDLKQAYACIAGTQSDRSVGAARADFQRMMKQEKVSFLIGNLQVHTQGDRATAALDVTQRTGLGGQSTTLHDNLILVREGAEWKIVSGTRAKPGQTGVLTSLLNAHQVEIGTACLSNIMQLSLAMHMYLQDRKDKFALKAAAFKQALRPYVKNERIFYCPGDSSGSVSYSFNRWLEGVTIDKIAIPSETVMVYEGSKEHLMFRHHGRATVGYVDGHVRLITAQMAQQLRWKP